jgi:hypothetical protein
MKKKSNTYYNLPDDPVGTQMSKSQLKKKLQQLDLTMQEAIVEYKTKKVKKKAVRK